MLKRNILFFQQSISLNDGGVPRVTDVLSKGLADAFTSHYIFYENDNEEYPASVKLKVSLEDTYKNLEQSVINFVEEKKIEVFICQNAYSFSFIKIYERLRKLFPASLFICCLHASPDYWQAYKINAGTVASWKLRAKSLMKRLIYPIYNPYIKTTSALYNLSDKFILLSDSFKMPFAKLYITNGDTSKLHTIPNPLTFKENISTSELEQKEKIVLIVSRLNEQQKKISTALAVWKEVTKSTEGWKLYIVGNGPDEKLYRRLVLEMKLENVAFTGHCDNVIDYYKRSSIFIMTSIWEGLPMTLLEAQQNGVVPVVFDNFSAVHDVIESDKNGFIIPNNNAKEFAGKVLRLMSDEGQRKQMAAESIQCSKRFNSSEILKMWKQVLG